MSARYDVRWAFFLSHYYYYRRRYTARIIIIIITIPINNGVVPAPPPGGYAYDKCSRYVTRRRGKKKKTFRKRKRRERKREKGGASIHYSLTTRDSRRDLVPEIRKLWCSYRHRDTIFLFYFVLYFLLLSARLQGASELENRFRCPPPPRFGWRYSKK